MASRRDHFECQGRRSDEEGLVFESVLGCIALLQIARVIKLVLVV